MLDVSQGQESFIPTELCQDNLPRCYKFYDPILLIIQERIPEDRKEYFYSRNKLNFKNYNDNDLKAKLFQQFFAGDQNSKLTFKHNCVNQKCRNEIDHTQSENTMCLQRSRYVMIDDDVTTILNKSDHNEQRKFFKGFYTENDNEKAQLRFKYCHPREVTVKKQK